VPPQNASESCWFAGFSGIEMNANVEQTGFSSTDQAKLWIAVVLAIGGLVAFYWFEDRYSVWMRSGMLIGGFALAALVIALSAYGSYLHEFFTESVFEMRKVVWPTRQETLQTTLVIAVVVIIISLLLFTFDSVLGVFFRWLFSASN